CNIINPDAMKDQLYITDCQVKCFIDFLKTRKILHKSRIIITSDHGMSTMKEFKKSPDVRKTLTEHGINSKANTTWRPYGYNDQGHYNWCSSEGTQIYIFCREENEQEIKKELLEHLPDYHEILDKESQEKKKMWKGDYDDVVWPRLIVFFDRNFANKYYGEGYAASGKMLAGLPPYIQLIIAKFQGLPGVPGTHGTPFEQDVPLIFYSPGELPLEGVIETSVSVIDIIPTINELNNWSDQPTFEGQSLLSLIKSKCSDELNKNQGKKKKTNRI
ncbi:unnamed protein product, partial [marine sediment metagenome]